MYDDTRMLSSLVHPELKKVHEGNSDDAYYCGKYEYLKRNGFFDTPKSAQLESVSELMIKEGISSVQQLVFEVTDSCNLNCTYCAYGDLYDVLDARNANNIDPNKAIKLLNYILDIKKRYRKDKLDIGFFGGEPLLNMKFIMKVVSTIKESDYGKNIDIKYHLTTNGLLVDKYIDFFVENKFDITISLDGNERNQSYRVFPKTHNNSFNKVISNVDFVNEKYHRYFIDHVKFVSVLHDRNSIKEIYEFIYNKYRKVPIISELLTKDVNPDKKDVIENMFSDKWDEENKYLEKEYAIKVAEFNSLKYKELKDYLKSYSINSCLSNFTSLLQKSTRHYPSSTCFPFTRKIFMTNRNKLLPCEKVNYKFCMGNVNDDVEINIREITRTYNGYYNKIKKVCQNCYLYKFCGLCIYHIDGIDKLNEEEFVCEYYCDKQAFSKRLSRIFSYLEEKPNYYFRILENL